MTKAKVYAKFQSDYPDPDTPTVLPTGMAELLKRRVDYQDSNPRVALDSEITIYNAILKDKGKEAADEWLTELWA